jgi:hypothetical protein
MRDFMMSSPTHELVGAFLHTVSVFVALDGLASLVALGHAI